MRYQNFALLTALLCLTLTACDLQGEEDTSGVVTLSGKVLDAQSNQPVSNAYVRVLPYDLLYEADEDGAYTFDVEVDSTMELRITATQDGYTSTWTEVLALAGRQIDVPTLRIAPTSLEDPESGTASNILLKGQSAQSVGVKESGSQEVASLTFQLADSLGRPVVLDASAEVRFSIGVGPGGGEFVHPTSARTDNNGQVAVNLSAGTRAGVVQVVAESDVPGGTIRSKPVSVAIHGGLPDQDHFSLGPDRFNFPGLRRYGLNNGIAVIVGDRYGNPVKPGTAVYFTTDAGVIGGSTATDDQGRGGVQLVSANPLPSDGIALITATTADENEEVVSSQTAVVMSGLPIVDVEPRTAILGPSYSMTVADQNGNPLAGGTSITVKVEGTRVKGVGHTNVLLDDTAFLGGLTYDDVVRGEGITEFSFAAVENQTADEEGEPTLETITILVSGPNGSVEIVLGGGGVSARTISEGEARVEHLDGSTARIRVLE